MGGTVKYSIIIPVYNAAKTLARCFDSLLVQNRDDIEIIAINDGSTDNSQQVIDKYKETYLFLKSVIQPNLGVSKARNVGLQIATGKYILFVDSDDYVSQDYFVELDNFNGADLCVFARENIGTGQTDSLFFESIDNKASFAEKVEKITLGRKILAPWNKRFKRDIIQEHQISFVDEFQIGEDFDFCMNYLRWCTSVQISSKILYYVDISDLNSLSRKYRPVLNEKLKVVYLHIHEMFAEQENACINKDNMLSIIDYLYVRNTFTCISEEFKLKKPHYFKEREKYRLICEDFTMVIGEIGKYVNVTHRVIRLLLRKKMFFLLYMITYMAKRK